MGQSLKHGKPSDLRRPPWDGRKLRGSRWGRHDSGDDASVTGERAMTGPWIGLNFARSARFKPVGLKHMHFNRCFPRLLGQALHTSPLSVLQRHSDCAATVPPATHLAFPKHSAVMRFGCHSKYFSGHMTTTDASSAVVNFYQNGRQLISWFSAVARRVRAVHKKMAQSKSVYIFPYIFPLSIFSIGGS